MDLVMVQDGEMPVVKLVDFNKLQYERQKNTKHNHPKQAKEIRIGPHTQEHDLQRLAVQAAAFIKEGHPVSVRLQVRGRNRMFKDLIRDKIASFAKMVEGAKPGRVVEGENGSAYTQSLS